MHSTLSDLFCLVCFDIILEFVWGPTFVDGNHPTLTLLGWTDMSLHFIGNKDINTQGPPNLPECILVPREVHTMSLVKIN